MALKHQSRRVAITGMGVLSPLGIGVAAFRRGLERGTQNLQRLKGMPFPHGKDLFAVCDWPSSHDRSATMALAVAREALASAGPDAGSGSEVGLLLGTMWGDTQAADEVYPELLDREQLAPHHAAALGVFPTGSIVDRLGAELGLRGPRIVISNACASGNIVLGVGMDLIRQGMCRTIVVIGVDRFGLTGLWGSERSGLIGRSLRPFDRDRTGTILGEGAACVVLERDSPSARGRAVAWMEGYHCASEPGAASLEFFDGVGLQMSMRGALADAGCRAEDIQYVNAHAPGTPHVDKVECRAVAEVWQGLDKPRINSTKALTGHLSGASAVVQIVATIVQMQGGFLHGHPGLKQVDPELTAAVVGSTRLDHRVSRSISNACGGERINTSVVVCAPDVEPAPAKSKALGRRILISGVGVERAPRRATGSEDPRWFDIDAWFADAKDKGYSFMNRAGQVAAIAAIQALEQARFDKGRPRVPAERVAVLGGAWLGGWQILNTALCEGLRSRPVRIYPSTTLDNSPHMGPLIICLEYGFVGAWHTVCGFVDSGLQALALAQRMILADRAEAAVVMGYDIDDPWLRRVTDWMPECTALRGFVEGAATVVIEAEKPSSGPRTTAIAELLGSAFASGDLEDDRQAAAAADVLFSQLGNRDVDSIVVSAPADAGIQRLGRRLAEVTRARLAPPGRTHSIAAESLARFAELPSVGNTLILSGASGSSQTAVLAAAL
jgi:3-oxoacyl-[acyl-carrier-protein] synthase II